MNTRQKVMLERLDMLEKQLTVLQALPENTKFVINPVATVVGRFGFKKNQNN